MKRKNNLPTWQRQAENKKRVKKRHFFLLTFGLIVLAVVAFLLYVFYQSWNSRIWTRQTTFTIGFNLVDRRTDQILLISFQPEEKTIAVFLLPENLLLKTVGQKGDYRAGSLFKLDELEGQNGRLFKTTLADNLGVFVDGFISLPVQDGFTPDSLTESNLKRGMNRLLLSWLKGQSKADLNFWDNMKLLVTVFLAKEGRIKIVNLADNQVVEAENLSDGSKVLRLNLPRIDRLSSQYFVDESLRQENLDVAVLNATQISGLAQNRARILSNSGVRVVKVDQYRGQEEIENDCLLLVSESQADSYTLFRLKQAFDCQDRLADVSWARASVVLILTD